MSMFCSFTCPCMIRYDNTAWQHVVWKWAAGKMSGTCTAQLYNHSTVHFVYTFNVINWHPHVHTYPVSTIHTSDKTNKPQAKKYGYSKV